MLTCVSFLSPIFLKRSWKQKRTSTSETQWWAQNGERGEAACLVLAQTHAVQEGEACWFPALLWVYQTQIRTGHRLHPQGTHREVLVEGTLEQQTVGTQGFPQLCLLGASNTELINEKSLPQEKCKDLFPYTCDHSLSVKIPMFTLVSCVNNPFFNVHW